MRFACASCSDAEEEADDTFWSELVRVIEKVDDPGEHAVMVNRSEWVDDRVEGFIGRYGIPGKNERVRELCALVGMSIVNMYFHYIDIHRYM